MSPLDYLYGRLNYERVSPAVQKGAFRLQRMRHLLRLMGHPERSTQIVHVGGTKGKGSTSSMIASMLVAGGRRVGLYTSPHLERLEERFRVDGASCTEEELFALVDSVRRAADEVEAIGEGPATFFELTTAMALEHFRRRECEISVVEVGLGGRLDSTNVCDPVVSVLTHVGLDHQHILGETVAKIAGEKAGIIKPGVPVVSGVRDPVAAAVIDRMAAERGARLWRIGRDFDVAPHTPASPPPDAMGAGPLAMGAVPHAAATGHDGGGNHFDFSAHSAGLHHRGGWYVPLEGQHQRGNAAVALAVLDALQPVGLGASLEDQRIGLARVRCDARIERFPGRPEVILDAAHNVDSIGALRAVLLDRPARDKTVVVFGTSADKDAGDMLAILADVADTLILTRYWSNPRWFDPLALAALARHEDSIVQPQPERALDIAISMAGNQGRVVICGSFFLAAELRPVLRARVQQPT